jgi:hypothetical protein
MKEEKTTPTIQASKPDETSVESQLLSSKQKELAAAVSSYVGFPERLLQKAGCYKYPFLQVQSHELLLSAIDSPADCSSIFSRSSLGTTAPVNLYVRRIRAIYRPCFYIFSVSVLWLFWHTVEHSETRFFEMPERNYYAAR